MSGLVVNDLVVKYGDTVAVDKASFVVRDGEFVSLLGPSGCGKTTTLRCIAGLERASAGTIQIGDAIVADGSHHARPERRQINMVFQSYAVWPHMTVFDNVAYGLKVRREPKPVIAERVGKVLDLVGLSSFAKRYGSELSGGQQQRVAVARALVTEPELILFDEPLSNLDAGLRIRMRDELMELQRRIGITTLYVTHDQSEAMAMSDQIVLMNGGKVEQIAEPRTLYQVPRTTFAARFIGNANIWPARVVSSDPASDRVTVEVSETLRLEIGSGDLTVQPGQSGCVLLRAENVLVAAAGETPANAMTATVSRVVFVGEHVDCEAMLDGTHVRFHVRPTFAIAPGDTVTLYAEPGSLVWIPEEPAETEEKTGPNGSATGSVGTGKGSGPGGGATGSAAMPVRSGNAAAKESRR